MAADARWVHALVPVCVRAGTANNVAPSRETVEPKAKGSGGEPPEVLVVRACVCVAEHTTRHDGFLRFCLVVMAGGLRVYLRLWRIHSHRGRRESHERTRSPPPAPPRQKKNDAVRTERQAGACVYM